MYFSTPYKEGLFSRYLMDTSLACGRPVKKAWISLRERVDKQCKAHINLTVCLKRGGWSLNCLTTLTHPYFTGSRIDDAGASRYAPHPTTNKLFLLFSLKRDLSSMALFSIE